MMRLPTQATAEGLDVAFIGIPMDIGTSNRSGTRHGPRQIRDESRMLRPFNMATGAAPFDHLQVADIGDVPINTFDLKKSVDIITDYYNGVLAHGVIPLTLGGDHTLTWPILRAIKAKHGPVALIHVDAHADINDTMFGEKVAHGCPFRRAWEDGCLINDKVFQIGLRGTGYSPDDFDWGRSKGWTVVQAEECWHKSLKPLMADIRATIGDAPVYLSYDIDSLDPAFAPGTGTVEPGGLTIWQGLEIVRGCAGLNLVGGDLVEVSPPYDPSGNTALVGANLLYEMLCVLPGVPQRKSTPWRNRDVSAPWPASSRQRLCGAGQVAGRVPGLARSSPLSAPVPAACRMRHPPQPAPAARPRPALRYPPAGSAPAPGPGRSRAAAATATLRVPPPTARQSRSARRPRRCAATQSANLEGHALHDRIAQHRRGSRPG